MMNGVPSSSTTGQDLTSFKCTRDKLPSSSVKRVLSDHYTVQHFQTLKCVYGVRNYIFVYKLINGMDLFKRNM